MRIACHTLGCKVNQYDTQAMLELFEEKGCQRVDFSQEADIYFINTCTVTGTGDQKSLKLIRRVHREHPQAAIVVAGCLAQRDAKRVMLPGVRLVIGVKRRAQVVELLERALAEDTVLCAVDTGGEWEFEPLRVCRHEGKTRAAMKIQEGCDRYCAYCVIPYVRGPVRSMPLEAVEAEARRLSQSGYREVVLTGIHLASYGRGMGYGLLDAIERVQNIPDIARIRLGSLENTRSSVRPGWSGFAPWTRCAPSFTCPCSRAAGACSSAWGAGIRRSNTWPPPGLLQGAYPHCAITTDVLTGFPGETQEEALETEGLFAPGGVCPHPRVSLLPPGGHPGGRHGGTGARGRKTAPLRQIDRHWEPIGIRLRPRFSGQRAAGAVRDPSGQWPVGRLHPPIRPGTGPGGAGGAVSGPSGTRSGHGTVRQQTMRRRNDAGLPIL